MVRVNPDHPSAGSFPVAPGPLQDRPPALRAGTDADHNGYPDLVVVAEEDCDLWLGGTNRPRFYREATAPSATWVQAKFPRGGEVFHAGSVRFVDWNTRKPFLKSLYRIREGMVPAQVDQIMSDYGGGCYGGSAAILKPSGCEFNEQGEIVTGCVTYTHTKEGWGNSDWGTVYFEDGVVVSTEFSPD